ncbi:hypothetical protein EX227_03285 [Providencia rettgeri]|uniref:Uncharacterized protein n=1 Tax=Providencia rettgeri TaxID=587 RepID=A0AAP2JXQ1_PRORE|nr:hypothetical protein [Providencia rettgeri]EMB3080631.1 hypothetical protein [Providencia rettgeri]MBX6949865.1 hypothetical protein [Providencia rettgeri]MBX6956624.1 hypothetical protein [Providencia rettgeri]MBX6960398.1 hypothetical protein [Providencia rettgeri]MBX6970744.1 hypothetical protein [Providencia rettgeri]
MPMFEIKDSENIELDNNKTNQKTLAKLDGVRNLKATNNTVDTAPKNEDELFECKPGLWGFSVNLKVLFKKLFRR